MGFTHQIVGHIFNELHKMNKRDGTRVLTKNGFVEHSCLKIFMRNKYQTMGE
jgi:hypothetical protein